MAKQNEKEKLKSARKALKPLFRSLVETAVKAHEDGKPVVAMIGVIPVGPALLVKCELAEVEIADIEARLATNGSGVVHGPEI